MSTTPHTTTSLPSDTPDTPSTPIQDDPEDTHEPPVSVPDSGDTGEGGKLKMIVQLVKKCLGVKDIAAMRLSLPASLLEPIPNLEFSHFLDRPDYFAAINDHEDPFERMLAVVRYSLTKDLKFIHGKICKPYNSVLGEHFRAHWDVAPLAYPSPASPVPLSCTITPSNSGVGPTSPIIPDSLSETASIKSGKSSKSTRSGLSFLSLSRNSPGGSTSTVATSPQLPSDNYLAAHMSNLNLTASNGTPNANNNNNVNNRNKLVRIAYLTEQVSHHPPISAYYALCPSRHLELCGIDQISAKVSGTTLRVVAGDFNRGIHVRVTGGHGEGELYRVTHPVANVNGILRGSFYLTVSESTIVTCSMIEGKGKGGGRRFRTVIEYKEESWLGRPHFLVEGVIHVVHDGETQHEEWTKVKHVPRSRVVAVFEGTWRGKIKWKRVGMGSYPQTIIESTRSSPAPSHEHLPLPSINPVAASSQLDVSDGEMIMDKEHEWQSLIDVSELRVVPKVVRAVERQLPDESRRLWESVTRNLVEKRYGEATKEKQTIEQRQRDDAAERRRKGVEFVPKYFEQTYKEGGIPVLTEDGWKALKEELGEEVSIDGAWVGRV
ncbi:hypothetical protein AMATHDRAFT_71985 [Amanita thiersii Skay4041]|uniref:Oxysterol-binding protein n=1 Tax=Amanita thiersii Skay4041 TaxID=703135 RepID=A0A2A9N6C8_9AGAR|nr:hypothetical protein AMATHDRAFT_71985 [Amanita thiersii Skay4041]